MANAALDPELAGILNKVMQLIGFYQQNTSVANPGQYNNIINAIGTPYQQGNKMLSDALTIILGPVGSMLSPYLFKMIAGDPFDTAGNASGWGSDRLVNPNGVTTAHLMQQQAIKQQTYRLQRLNTRNQLDTQDRRAFQQMFGVTVDPTKTISMYSLLSRGGLDINHIAQMETTAARSGITYLSRKGMLGTSDSNMQAQADQLVRQTLRIGARAVGNQRDASGKLKYNQFGGLEVQNIVGQLIKRGMIPQFDNNNKTDFNKLARKVQDITAQLRPLKDIFGRDIPAMFNALQQLSGQAFSSMSARQVANQTTKLISLMKVTGVGVQDISKASQAIREQVRQINPRTADSAQLASTGIAQSIIQQQNGGMGGLNNMTTARFNSSIANYNMRVAASQGGQMVRKALGMYVQKQVRSGNTTDIQGAQATAISKGIELYKKLVASGMSDQQAARVLAGNSGIVQTYTGQTQAVREASAGLTKQRAYEQAYSVSIAQAGNQAGMTVSQTTQAAEYLQKIIKAPDQITASAINKQAANTLGQQWSRFYSAVNQRHVIERFRAHYNQIQTKHAQMAQERYDKDMRDIFGDLPANNGGNIQSIFSGIKPSFDKAMADRVFSSQDTNSLGAKVGLKELFQYNKDSGTVTYNSNAANNKLIQLLRDSGVNPSSFFNNLVSTAPGRQTLFKAYSLPPTTNPDDRKQQLTTIFRDYFYQSLIGREAWNRLQRLYTGENANQDMHKELSLIFKRADNKVKDAKAYASQQGESQPTEQQQLKIRRAYIKQEISQLNKVQAYVYKKETSGQQLTEEQITYLRRYAARPQALQKTLTDESIPYQYRQMLTQVNNMSTSWGGFSAAGSNMQELLQTIIRCLQEMFKLFSGQDDKRAPTGNPRNK